MEQAHGCSECASRVVLEAISRRAFLSQTAMVAGAAFLAGCGAGDAMAPSTVNFSFKLADYPALATVGGVALVDAGTPVAVVRTGTDTFLALSRICPHAGATINPTTSGFQCPRHGARFDAAGTWTGGERTSNLHSYSTSFDAGTGTITIG